MSELRIARCVCVRNRGLRGLHGGRGKDFMLMLPCLVLSLFMGKHSVPNEDKKNKLGNSWRYLFFV